MTEAKAITRDSRRQIVCFGDSITQFANLSDPIGWISILSTTYTRQLDIINRGYSGYNTRWAAAMLPQVLNQFQQQHVALVTIAFGANDAIHPKEGQHVPLDEYQENLRQMVTIIRSTLSSETLIVLIAPPPVDDEIRPVRKCQDVEKYAAACCMVGKDLNVPVANMFQAMQQVPNWTQHCFNDGLHLSTKGNQIFAQTLQDTIEAAYPELKPSSLPLHFPLWGDMLT